MGQNRATLQLIDATKSVLYAGTWGRWSKWCDRLFAILQNRHPGGSEHHSHGTSFPYWSLTMRNFKNIALIAALALGSSAFAVGSTPLDYDHATAVVVASGTTAQSVSFSVPQTTVAISSGYMRPGATYTVEVPVTNTTDRKISISADSVLSGDGAALVTLSGGAAVDDVMPGETATLSYTVILSSAADAAAFAGKSVTLTFTINAASTSTN